MMRSPQKKWLIRGVATLVIGVVAATAWNHFNPRREESLASGNGRIEATEIDVAARIAGRIKEILVREGEFVKDVRGRGLMYGIELPNDRYGAGYTLAMIKNGIFADYCGNNEKTIKLMPPLIITHSQIKETIAKLTVAMDSLPRPALI